MTSNHNQAPIIIPLPSSRQLEPLVEEINVVRLEGHYFCFDPREAKRRTGALEFVDGNRKIRIQPHPAFGQPSVLAYRILQAVFRKITLEGKPFPETVSFSGRELGRLSGRSSWGGRDSAQLTEAIRQLRQTTIYISQICSDGKKLKGTEYDLNLFIESGIIKDHPTEAIEGVVLTIHPRIIESMRRNHFIILNWNFISELPPLSAAIYKRLYLHLSNVFEERSDKRGLRFEKSYADICRDWLGGLKVWKYKADAHDQLKPHIKALIDCGFLSSFLIEKMADGGGLKLVFKPGAAFYKDYERFYKNRNARVLQFQQAADSAAYHEPVEITRYFYGKLLGVQAVEEGTLSSSDVQFSREILARFSLDEAKAFIDYGIEAARASKWNIKTIHALKRYFTEWEANKERRAEAQKLEQERRRLALLNRQRNLYEELLKRHQIECIEGLSSKAKSLLRDRAEFEVMQKSGRGLAFELGVTMAMRRIILEEHPFPSFEDWQKSQN